MFYFYINTYVICYVFLQFLYENFLYTCWSSMFVSKHMLIILDFYRLLYNCEKNVRFLLNYVCWLVGRSAGRTVSPSARPSVRLLVRPSICPSFKTS